MASAGLYTDHLPADVYVIEPMYCLKLIITFGVFKKNFQWYIADKCHILLNVCVMLKIINS